MISLIRGGGQVIYDAGDDQSKFLTPDGTSDNANATVKITDYDIYDFKILIFVPETNIEIPLVISDNKTHWYFCAHGLYNVIASATSTKIALNLQTITGNIDSYSNEQRITFIRSDVTTINGDNQGFRVNAIYDSMRIVKIIGYK